MHQFLQRLIVFVLKASTRRCQQPVGSLPKPGGDLLPIDSSPQVHPARGYLAFIKQPPASLTAGSNGLFVELAAAVCIDVGEGACQRQPKRGSGPKHPGIKQPMPATLSSKPLFQPG